MDETREEDKIEYKVVGTQVTPFSYRTPLVIIDENGECQVNYSKHEDDSIHVKRINFLYVQGRCVRTGKLLSFEPLDCVNHFLMAHHLDDGNSESDQYSKALIHYFSFLIGLQEAWDENYDEEYFDPFIDPPRPDWDVMPTQVSKRSTYMYREALKYAVVKQKDPDLKLAQSTAKAYMRGVVKFYTYHLRQGKVFDNEPFKYEIVSLHVEAHGTSMKPYKSIEVHTTDLRLKMTKAESKESIRGLERRDLMPLSKAEWLEIKKILTKTKRVLKSVKGTMKLSSVAEETSLFFLLCRYVGMRREEVASLHLGQITKPIDSESRYVDMGIGDEYGSLTKDVKGSGNKSRVVKVPTPLMWKLYEYSRTDRYHKRLCAYKDLCKSKRATGEDGWFEATNSVNENQDYLFLSTTGIPYFKKLADINARWTEIRNTVSEILGYKLTASPHNLRSTFACSLFRALLSQKDEGGNQRLTNDQALAFVSSLLGHENIDTTLIYLQIAKDEPSGDEIYEDVLEYLGIIEDEYLGND